jgi:hypothetical protein
MTDPASVISSLAFQEFLKSGAGELAKRFTGAVAGSNLVSVGWGLFGGE